MSQIKLSYGVREVYLKYQRLSPPFVIARNASIPGHEARGQNYVNLEPCSIATLQENASPIPRTSRLRNEEDQELFCDEVNHLIDAGVKEKAQSPWRA